MRLAALLLCVVSPACVGRAEQGGAYRAPRTGHGTPDLSGIWQANNTANWNVEPHAAQAGPMFQLGAAFSIPPGLGVVDGGEIPYLPSARTKREQKGLAQTRSRGEVLHAGHPARHLHALSISDRAVGRQHPLHL
jgi:hypothetical protein